MRRCVGSGRGKVLLAVIFLDEQDRAHRVCLNAARVGGRVAMISAKNVLKAIEICAQPRKKKKYIYEIFSLFLVYSTTLCSKLCADGFQLPITCSAYSGLVGQRVVLM